MKELPYASGILTGASRGLGARLALALADAGMDLVLVARSREQLESVAADVRRRGVRAAVVAADITSAEGRASAVDAALREFGRIDLLLNNAGLETLAPYHDSDPGEVARIVDVNLLAPMLLTRDVLPHMLERGYGHVLNMSSIAGKAAAPYGVAYAATKHGLAGFTASLRAELRGSGVSASVVCPVFVTETGMYANMVEGTAARAPLAVGTVSPDQVVREVMETLRRDRPEAIVGQWPLRPLLATVALTPRFMDAFMRVARVTEQLRHLAAARRTVERAPDEPQESRAST